MLFGQTAGGLLGMRAQFCPLLETSGMTAPATCTLGEEIDSEELIGQNADALWLHRNEMWEEIRANEEN